MPLKVLMRQDDGSLELQLQLVQVLFHRTNPQVSDRDIRSLLKVVRPQIQRSNQRFLVYITLSNPGK